MSEIKIQEKTFIIIIYEIKFQKIHFRKTHFSLHNNIIFNFNYTNGNFMHSEKDNNIN